jgi:RNA polymerase sigma-70 factor, ECF subfamily
LTFTPQRVSLFPLRFGLSEWGMLLGSKSSTEVTELLARWSQGESAAREKLVPLIYEELRRVARHCLAGQRPDHTLQSAALVHEAYLRLLGYSSVHWDDRVHFFAVAAQLMRRILVDHARKRCAAKRGGERVTLALDERLAPAKQRELDLVALDDALHELSRMNPQQGRMVEMRFFGGLSIEETAQFLGISPATVKRDWAVARAWLYREMVRSTQV